MVFCLTQTYISISAVFNANDYCTYTDIANSFRSDVQSQNVELLHIQSGSEGDHCWHLSRVTCIICGLMFGDLSGNR